ncbi:MAG TPA: regulatory protein RecX [Xanthomonadaceae bacterium]|nr:regulatory protein RecX [Xanthomonadaceae bacterium]
MSDEHGMGDDAAEPADGGTGAGGTARGRQAADKPKRRRPEPSPAQRALGLLVRREHSQRELTRKLVTRGVGADEAAGAVARLREAGWQDDTRFACSLARTRATNGYGPLHIRAELRTHALPEAVVASAFAALAEAGEDDWPRRAAELVRRRFGTVAGDAAKARRAADLLARRGFDGDSIRAAVRGLPDAFD